MTQDLGVSLPGASPSQSWDDFSRRGPPRFLRVACGEYPPFSPRSPVQIFGLTFQRSPAAENVVSFLRLTFQRSSAAKVCCA